jgi:hypothetical protein
MHVLLFLIELQLHMRSGSLLTFMPVVALMSYSTLSSSLTGCSSSLAVGKIRLRTLTKDVMLLQV